MPTLVVEQLSWVNLNETIEIGLNREETLEETTVNNLNFNGRK